MPRAGAFSWPACSPSSLTSAVGFLNGLIITAGKIPDFVVTLGTLSAVTGLGLILSGGEPTMVG